MSDKNIKKFTGKKLLILGSSLGATSMVKYARDNDCYVIVTDYLPKNQSPAKQIADESIDISTQDFDALEKFARKRNIDGIFCGVSELNLLAVRELCNRLNLPCYFTNEQWQLCQQKRKFKHLCLENNVPTPIEYLIDPNTLLGIKTIKYPVIVKPVDGSAAKGITICRNEKDLISAIPYALSESNSHEIIVEEYVVGTEFTAVYTIADGNIVLSCLRDRFPTLDHANVTAQFDASISPSLYYQRYMESVHPYIINLLKSIKMNNGCVFFQGIVNKKRIVVFVCGLRMNALLDFYNISAATGENYMEMLINFALTGNMGSSTKDYDNKNAGYWCIFNMSCHEGKIALLAGNELCMALPNVVYCQFLLPVGKEVIETNSMAQSVFRAFINAPSLEELQNTITCIQKYINVCDSYGNSMLFLPFDINRLNNYKF